MARYTSAVGLAHWFGPERWDRSNQDIIIHASDDWHQRTIEIAAMAVVAPDAAPPSPRPLTAGLSRSTSLLGRDNQADVESLFERLSEQWMNETAFTPDLSRIVMHSAYQRIIGLGAAALPLILRSLRNQPHHWFWALAAIVGEDKAAGAPDLVTATDAWIRWGESEGLLS